MSRLTAFLVVFALWAGIFLPGLGSTELKGEEGRRILPAITMLQGGSLIVPEVGGKAFLRKPPLVQWCIAASIKIFGKKVWAARLPSALAVLALASVIILCTRGWLITEQSLFAAIIMMTQVATVEKCRLAEMESIYVGLSGISLVLWMSWWAQGRSPWLLWLVPMIFNGLAVLAKAPMHLLFFYAVVLCVLFSAKKMRDLLRPAHFAGVAILFAVVALWAVPYSITVDSEALARTLNRQAVERFTSSDFNFGNWLLSVPRGIANHLPWILFAPLLWSRKVCDGLNEKNTALICGGRWALLGCFALLLVPGVLPRYIQPLVVPFSLLMAPVLWECPHRFRQWWRHGLLGFTFLLFLFSAASPFLVAGAVSEGAEVISPAFAGIGIMMVFAGAILLMQLRHKLHESMHLALWTSLIFAMAMLIFATSIVPWMRLKDDIRPFAERIDDALPAGSELIAYRIGDDAPLLATLFYLKAPYTYAAESESAPADERFYLVRGKEVRKFKKSFRVIGDPLLQWDRESPPALVLRAQKNP